MRATRSSTLAVLSCLRSPSHGSHVSSIIRTAKLPCCKQPLPPARRTFITLPDALAPPPQTLSSRLTVPHHHSALYSLIADVDSYRQFLPYCKVSRVTAWTTPATTSASDAADPSAPPSDSEVGRRWPTRADLTAGWGGFEETYTSRLFCVPHLRIVEAISGDARTKIAAADLRRAGRDVEDEQALARGQHIATGGVFKSLVTRWTVHPAADPATGRIGSGNDGGNDWSDVRLDIEFRFANPLYAAVSSAVADKIAPLMVEAFCERAGKVLGRQKRVSGAA